VRHNNYGKLSANRKLLYVLRQFGFDPVAFFLSVKNLPWFFRSYSRFIKEIGPGAVSSVPTLTDKGAESGSADGHYFWQDLICATWIYQQRKNNHFDVGSRIDGFIAHLLTFMQVTILDVRPLKSNIPNLTVLIGNAQKEFVDEVGTFDSVSSLHSIEHFGLGRYGDEIDPLGHEAGLANIAECVKLGGLLYVSFPIGTPSVEFNSQRVIDPMWAIENLPDFILEEFVLIPWRGAPIFELSPNEVDRNVWGQAGLYRFKRVTSHN
jgi:hypothetical protein